LEVPPVLFAILPGVEDSPRAISDGIQLLRVGRMARRIDFKTIMVNDGAERNWLEYRPKNMSFKNYKPGPISLVVL